MPRRQRHLSRKEGKRPDVYKQGVWGRGRLPGGGTLERSRVGIRGRDGILPEGFCCLMRLGGRDSRVGKGRGYNGQVR